MLCLYLSYFLKNTVEMNLEEKKAKQFAIAILWKKNTITLFSQSSTPIKHGGTVFLSSFSLYNMLCQTKPLPMRLGRCVQHYRL